MSTVDQIAAATGLATILNRQQAKQAGLTKELASGIAQASIAEALATPFETESQTLPVVEQIIALAGAVLSTSDQALSNVAANLTRALATASRALSAPPSEHAVLAENFNMLLDETEGFVDSATVNGLNLVGSDAKPISVTTTTEGGQLTLAAAPSSARSLGVGQIAGAGWSSAAEIEASIDQIRNALNRITSVQSKFAAALSVLQAASLVNESSALAASSTAAALVGADVGAAILDQKRSLAQSELSTYVSDEHSLRHARNILGLLDK